MPELRGCVQDCSCSKCSWWGPRHEHPIRWYWQIVILHNTNHTALRFLNEYCNTFSSSDTNLSSHCDCSCRSTAWRGYSLPQNLHSDGSSLTAFSTAGLRHVFVLLISTRQLGQWAVASRKRESASRVLKHPVHIKCPFMHYEQIWP